MLRNSQCTAYSFITKTYSCQPHAVIRPSIQLAFTSQMKVNLLLHIMDILGVATGRSRTRMFVSSILPPSSALPDAYGVRQRQGPIGRLLL